MPGAGGEQREVLADPVVLVGALGDGPGDGLRVVTAEEVVADAGHDDSAEAVGVLRRQSQEDPGTEGEGHGVDGLRRQRVGDPGLEPGVGLGIVGLVGVAVAEEVEGQHLTAEVAEEVDPAVVPPRPLRRGGEAVEEEDRRCVGRGHRRGP